eukprot:CAMPEP_0171106582 /NCGR_PEP_ID=MMETSP0766_2-20121228/65066_1 /TAXON_ID=439317 /ORGANISM="Gambierdiscus australes, Strain CAWD 149" /LENGTH=202 /DNA_ID=CAMNT_0011567699 /DNA_START=53 /DNA_END=661 /DNA_ORIENTATION=+
MAGALSAQIDTVEIADPEPDDGNILKQGLGVLKTRISFLGGGQHAIYNVRIQRNEQYYSIKKRFSEFAVFHDYLKGKFGPSLPFDLPAKTALRQFSQEKLEDRKNALNAYLKEICRRQEFLNCPEVVRFFEPQSAVPGASAPLFAPEPQARSSRGLPVSATVAASVPAAPPVATGPLVAGAPPGASPPTGQDSDDDLAGWDR